MVIGPQVAEALFPNQSRVVGSQVTFYGKIFEIVGVLEKRKVAFFTGESEEDNAVFIPLSHGTQDVAPQRMDYVQHPLEVGDDTSGA